MNILVVHESELIRSDISEMLSKIGSVNIKEVSPDQALDELQGNKYDLVFTGLMMHRNGFDLILNIKKLEINTKIIAVSESEEKTGLSEAAERFGAYRVLSFPLKKTQIEDIFKNL